MYYCTLFIAYALEYFSIVQYCKVIVIYCIMYYIQEAHSAANYTQNIQDALDILRDNVPRAYVNLVEIFDISPIAGLGNSMVCDWVHR